MKNIYFLLLLSSVVSMAQTQIGSDINGEFENDGSGRSISISSDGSIVAIGVPKNDGNGTDSGHVRVYKNILGVWTQIGSDINGEFENDESGHSVSLSSDGNIVAIGAPKNDGNGTNSGHVRVYKNILGVWTQIGSDINGERANDLSGISVSLSSDGNIVAIGAHENYGNFNISSGHVRVYRNVSGVWMQIGTDINGEGANDWFGFKVCLSSDGNIVAISAPLNDNNSDLASAIPFGHVRVYRNISDVWTQIGNDIDGEAPGDWSGVSLALSSDGNIVAIGTHLNDGNGENSGHVRVYQNISDVWIQIGNDIDGEALGDLSGRSCSLSSDGSIVAIGAEGNNGNGEVSGHVRIYKNILGVWTQIGNDIDGEAAYDLSGSGVSLSSDGSILAIGAIGNDGNGSNSGHVRVYDLTAILSSDSFVQSNFKLYPNPSNGIVNISLEDNLQLEKVSVYNQLGQLVKTVETNVIYTTELVKGTYYVEVVTNQGKATKKIIVE